MINRLFFVMGLITVLLFVSIGMVSATDYYVSLSGDDANNGTTLDTAWRTIDYAVDHVSAGDTIYAVPGNYGAEHVTITTSGTESNPIKITRYGASGTITLKHNVEATGYGIRVDSNYWIIEYFDISDYSYDVYITGDHNTLNFCDAHGKSDQGFIVGSAGAYNVFNECIAHDITWGYRRGNGFRLMGRYNLMKDCISHDVDHFCISIDNTPSNNAIGNTVDGGEYYNTPFDSTFAIADATDTTIKNVVRISGGNLRTYACSTNTTIKNCIFYDMGAQGGIKMQGAGGLVINNVIHNWTERYGVWSEAWDVVYSGNDMRNPSHTEYRIYKRDFDPNNPEMPLPYSCENITIENQVDDSFRIVTTESEGVGNMSVTIKYTDGRTFSVNGVGEYTTYTIESIENWDTFDIETIGGVLSGIISGIVKDVETDNPILGVTITANGYSNNTNVSGYYEIQNVTIGNYTVTASKAGYITESSENVQVLENQTTTINFNLTAAPEPVGYWKFDEGSGMFANDSSGCNNNGSISGATWITGNLNSALDFDGVDNYVVILQSASLDSITSEITLEAWVRTPITSEHTILARYLCGAVNERSYEFNVEANGKVYFSLSGDGSSSDTVWIKSNTSISSNTWTHVAATSDGTTMKIYINGKQDVNTANSPTGIHPSTGDLHIGRLLYISPDDWYYPFNGTIDEVKIYSRALSPHEFYGYNISGYAKYENLTAALNVHITNNVTSLNNYSDADGFYNTNLPNGSYAVKAEKFGYFSNSTDINVLGVDIENVNMTLGSYFADKIRAQSSITIYTNGTYSYSEEPIGKTITNWSVLPLNNEIVVNATDNSTVTVTSTGANQVWLNTTIPAFANKEVQLIRNGTPVATTDANATGFISHLYIGGFSTYEFEYQAGSPPAGNISGFIYSTDTNPIQDAVCYLSYTNGSYLAMVNTSADGSYNFTNVASGDYYVFAKELNISSGKSNATVAANITTWVNMTLYREESLITDQNVFVSLSGSFDFESDALNFSCNRTDLFTDFSTALGEGNWTASSGVYAVKFGTSDGIGYSNKTIIFSVMQFNQSVKTNYWQYISQMKSTAKYPYQLNATLGNYVEYIVAWNETGQVWHTAWIREWNNSVTDQVDSGDGFLAYFSQDNSFTRDNCAGGLNWSFSDSGYYLTGLDYNGTRTLSQINTSISNSNLSQLIYVNETGSDFIYTYGSAANGTVEVKQGQAFWVKVTGIIEKVRSW